MLLIEIVLSLSLLERNDLPAELLEEVVEFFDGVLSKVHVW